jgi:hypothetical protein
MKLEIINKRLSSYSLYPKLSKILFLSLFIALIFSLFLHVVPQGNAGSIVNEPIVGCSIW